MPRLVMIVNPPDVPVVVPEGEEAPASVSPPSIHLQLEGGPFEFSRADVDRAERAITQASPSSGAREVACRALQAVFPHCTFDHVLDAAMAESR